MKTTKQIYLLMEKKGSELAALAEGLDKIIVTEETLRTMFDGKETDSVNASPILEKGVSVQIGDEIKDYLIFEVMERKGDSFKIHCESYQEYCGKGKNFRNLLLSGLILRIFPYPLERRYPFLQNRLIMHLSVSTGSRSYIFAAKNPDACVGDESHINKVKSIFFFTAPKKKGFFFV